MFSFCISFQIDYNFCKKKVIRNRKNGILFINIGSLVFTFYTSVILGWRVIVISWIICLSGCPLINNVNILTLEEILLVI